MDGNPAAAWFVGDLGDPWVLSIAEALPAEFSWISCPGDLPEDWSVQEGPTPPSTIVLHRANLNATDATRLGRLLTRSSAPVRVVLCVSPHVRHDDLVRWSRLTETVLPEATAAESLARRFAVSPRKRPENPLPLVSVLSTDFEWREMIADLCRAAGYEARGIYDEAANEVSGLIVWDTPVLRNDWPDQLRQRSRIAKVVAMLGFADRDLVDTARKNGAAACLDAPFDQEDLVWVLDRLTTSRPLTRASLAHSGVPAPAFMRHRPGDRQKLPNDRLSRKKSL